MPGAVEQRGQQHDGQPVAAAQSRGDIRAGDGQCMGVQDMGTRLRELRPDRLADLLGDLAVSDIWRVVEYGRFGGQHGGHHQLGDRVLGSAEAYLPFQRRAPLNNPGIHRCEYSFVWFVSLPTHCNRARRNGVGIHAVTRLRIINQSLGGDNILAITGDRATCGCSGALLRNLNECNAQKMVV